ncbi:uncharacterized protein LOC128231533 isoform X2 [Mya arenaria]|uniref:uncharacterized protein LOC128231533 isoform X2 n=1 Tax=Mya arenaria TaxID=6604 RepID=UPI0022E4B04B|nr:uncharacterized protein LOC128231533 isoform X2 [Mya arenaria]
MSGLHSYDEDKVSFHYIDEHAKKASAEHADSMLKLVEYLRDLYKQDPDSDLYLARAILVWISDNKATRKGGDEAKGKADNTPRGCMALLQKSEFEIFRKLFDTASIKYEVVEGLVKNIRYRAGDRQCATNRWICFHSNGRRHLLHPEWATKAVRGQRHGDETTLEKDGTALTNHQTGNAGQITSIVNDFWFCTRPDIFITRCFPNDPTFQLLPQSSQLKPKEFFDLPDLRQEFFTRKFALLSKKTCCLASENGECNIALTSKDDSSNNLEFSYELVLHESGIQNREEANMIKNKSKRLVLPQVKHDHGDTFIFDVRCPYKGDYWLRLKVGFHNSEEKFKCCEFKISCSEPNKEWKVFPPSHGLEVFGFGPKAADAGLIEPSVDTAKIAVKPRSSNEMETVMTFHLADSDEYIDTEYSSELYGSDFVGGENIERSFEGCTETIKDIEKRKVKVNACIPQKGEYSLIINANTANGSPQQEQKKASKKAIACYFVTTDSDIDPEDENRKRTKRMKAVKKENKREMKENFKHNLETSLEIIKQELVDLEKKASLIKPRDPKTYKRVLHLDSSEKRALLSESGKRFLDNRRPDLEGKLVFAMRENGQFSITYLSTANENVIDIVLKCIRDFLAQNSLYMETLLLDRNVHRYIKLHQEEALKAISHSLNEEHVHIYLCQEPLLLVTGSRKGIHEATKRLQDLRMDLIQKHHAIYKDGAYEFFLSKEGQDRIEHIERACECVITIEGFEDKQDGTTETEAIAVAILGENEYLIDLAIGELETSDIRCSQAEYLQINESDGDECSGDDILLGDDNSEFESDIFQLFD